MSEKSNGHTTVDAEKERVKVLLDAALTKVIELQKERDSLGVAFADVVGKLILTERERDTLFGMYQILDKIVFEGGETVPVADPPGEVQ